MRNVRVLIVWGTIMGYLILFSINDDYSNVNVRETKFSLRYPFVAYLSPTHIKCFIYMINLGFPTFIFSIIFLDLVFLFINWIDIHVSN